MDKRILFTLALGAMSQVFAHAWEPKGDKIKTVWAEQVTPENVYLRNGCKDGSVPHIKSGTVYLVNIPALLRKLGVENDE